MSVKDSSGNEIINVFRRPDHGAVISYRNIDYTMARHDGRYEQTFAATNTIRVFKDETTGELSKDFKSLKCHKSRNLYNELYTPGFPSGGNLRYEPIFVGDGTFTCSSNTPLAEGTSCCLFFISGRVSSGASTVVNGVSNNVSRTVQSENGYVTLAYRNYRGVSPANYYVMLNLGTSPLPYEPYGELYSADLKDYTIYGDTVNGESVGDKTGNLFDSENEQGGLNGGDGAEFDSDNRCRSGYILLDAGTYTISISSSHTIGLFIFSSTNVFETFVSYSDSPITFSLETVKKVRFGFSTFDGTVSITPSDISNIMLNDGSTALPYEPYGYKVLVTVEGKNLWSSGVEQGSVSHSGNYDANSKRIRSKNIPLEPGTYKLTSNLSIRLIYAYNGVTKVGVIINNSNGINNPTFTVPDGANNVSIGMLKRVDGAEVDITPADFEHGQIEKGSTATPYEPYQTPVTTNIYIPEPLKAIYNGDSPYYTDYINYKKQILHKEGINKFASDWEAGTISTSTGENEGSNSYYRTKDYIPLDPRGWYTFARAVSGTVMVFGYDENKNYVGHDTDIDVELYSSTTFQNDFAPYGVAYLKFVQAYPGQLPENWHYMLLEGYFESESSLPPYEPCIDGDTPVTLPALPTLYKTNTISVESTVAPSRADFTGHIKTISGGS